MKKETLTKKMLEDWGFVDASSEDGIRWRLTREWYGKGLPGSGERKKVVKEITPSLITRTHPYGNDKSYYGVAFSVGGRSETMTLARFVYAWFVGDVPAGMQVDHIDNDPLNNDPANLRLVTPKENIRKRFWDARGMRNQLGQQNPVACSADPEDVEAALKAVEAVEDLVEDEKAKGRIMRAAKDLRGMLIYLEGRGD